MHVVNRVYGENSDTVCRLCSSNSGIMVLNIFDTEGRRRRVSTLIKDCLPVQICENDPLPKVICHSCLHKLEVFHEFQKECLKSEESLKTLRCNTTQSSFSSFRDTAHEYSGKSAYTTREYVEKPPYPEFRRASQDFSDSHASRNVPDFTAELHPVLPEEQHPQSSIQCAEESPNVTREIIDCIEPPVEVMMVKQEPEEVKSPMPEEDTRWDNCNVEEENNGMQMEHAEPEMLQSEDDVKSELYGGIDSPIISEETKNTRHEEDGEKRKRGRKRRPDLWKKNIEKFARYAPKSMPAYPACGHSSNAFRCASLTMADIMGFHHSFYSTRIKAEQDLFLLKHCSLEPVKRRRGKGILRNPKLTTSKCFVQQVEGGRRIPVCQRTFVGILGVTKNRLIRVLNRYFGTGEMPRENRGGNRRSAKRQTSVGLNVFSDDCVTENNCNRNSSS